MKFYIVTPTFNSLNWLPCALRSVLDQASAGIEVHHHIQDGLSTDGTPQWLEEWKQAHANTPNYRMSYTSERDNGMYDAINRGWAQLPADADFTAQLNSDEQYLPQALQAVAEHAPKHARADVLLASYMILDGEFNYICHRRPVIPRKWSSWLNCACITCASFYRAESFRKHKLEYNTSYRCVSDLVFFRDLTHLKLRFATIPTMSSTFLCTGQNLAWTKKAHDEWLSLHPEVPYILRQCNGFIYRWVNLKRRIANYFLPAPTSFDFYKGNNTKRIKQSILKATARWGHSFEPEKTSTH